MSNIYNTKVEYSKSRDKWDTRTEDNTCPEFGIKPTTDGSI